MVRSILPLAEHEKGGGGGFSCDVKSETPNYVLYAHGRYSPQWRSTSKTGAPLQKHPKVLYLVVDPPVYARSYKKGLRLQLCLGGADQGRSWVPGGATRPDTCSQGFLGGDE